MVKQKSTSKSYSNLLVLVLKKQEIYFLCMILQNYSYLHNTDLPQNKWFLLTLLAWKAALFEGIIFSLQVTVTPFTGPRLCKP